MSSHQLTLTIPSAADHQLAAKLDLPIGKPKAYALFAHCFTCSKDFLTSRKISEALTKAGFAVMRFDFTGLGRSDGDFAETNFSSNKADLRAAIAYMRETYQAPALMVGHSLGGAAVLSVAGHVPEVRAVATIGAPAEAAHVIHNFGDKLDEIEKVGEAEVNLSQRPFTIKKQFVDDVEDQNVLACVGRLKKPLLVMHAPFDNTVSIDNAREIFAAAKHPKSFVSLDDADHLVSNPADAAYAASVIAGWAARYIEGEDNGEALPSLSHGDVLVRETGLGNYQNDLFMGAHHSLVDEPTSMGGLDTGPAPYELLAASLGSCTSITLRMYADRKKWPVENIAVKVTHARRSKEEAGDGPLDVFTREITVLGDLDEKQHARMLQIANKCPVHRTLEAGAHVVTRAVN